MGLRVHDNPYKNALTRHSIGNKHNSTVLVSLQGSAHFSTLENWFSLSDT